MRTRACLISLLLAVASATIAVPYAEAEDKDAVIETARRRFQEGVKYFDQKRYEEARAAFLQAYALKRHPAVLLNLAQSEARSGHPAEAARHFATYLRESPNAPANERADAEKGLASARTKLGRIHVTAPSGAEVLLDGELMGQSPLPEQVDATPGSHVLEARMGGRNATASVAVQVGKSTNATLSLDSGQVSAPLPPPVAPTSPTVPPTAPSEAQEKPAVEPAKENPSPSEAGVQVSTEGREPFFGWLAHNGVGIAGVAATIVGAGVGTGFLLAANKASQNSDSVTAQIQQESTNIGVDSHGICVDPVTKVNQSSVKEDQKAGEIQRFQQACSLLTDNLDKSKQDRTYATVGFVLAGVGLTATFVTYFLTSNRGSSSSALVVPVVSPGHAGLAVVGSF
jgi:Tfp pilus assembly protein PilF